MKLVILSIVFSGFALAKSPMLKPAEIRVPSVKCIDTIVPKKKGFKGYQRKK